MKIKRGNQESQHNRARVQNRTYFREVLNRVVGRTMARNNRNISAWIMVIACSYFAHTLYWLTRSARFNFFYLYPNQDVFGNVTSSVFGGFIIVLVWGIGGLTIRFIGAINAVSASYQVWRKGMSSLASVKGRISNALFCEGLYWGAFRFVNSSFKPTLERRFNSLCYHRLCYHRLCYHSVLGNFIFATNHFDNTLSHCAQLQI